MNGCPVINQTTAANEPDLNNLSLSLSDMGCCNDTTDHPATFNPDLAWSLDNLSLCLSDMGLWEDALQAIQEAVKIYQ